LGRFRWPVSVVAAAVVAVSVGWFAVAEGAGRGAGAGAGDVRAAANEPSSGLQLSVRADRRDARPLAGAVASGKIYVMLTAAAAQPASVAFRLDDALGAARVTEKSAPFDFAGGAQDGSANPLDTASLPNGPHVILAEVTAADGTVSGIYARFTVSNGASPTSTTSSTTPPATSTTRPTTQPPTSTTPPSTKPCAGYPTPACTGAPAGVKLETVNGDLTASTPGQVIDGKRITGRVIVAANDVTIRNSEVYGGITGYASGKLSRFTVSDTTVGAPTGCNGGEAVGSSRYTATRLHVRNFGDGFRDSGDDILIQDSYVKLCSNPGDHSDGVQGYKGGKNVVVRHNTIDQRDAKDVTSPVFFADESAGAVLENNLLAGGGYTVRLHGSGFTFTGNQVVKDSWRFGPVNSDCPGVKWADNRLVVVDADYRVTSVAGPLNCG
jgi:hypothetical protein